MEMTTMFRKLKSLLSFRSRSLSGSRSCCSDEASALAGRFYELLDPSGQYVPIVSPNSEYYASAYALLCGGTQLPDDAVRISLTASYGNDDPCDLLGIPWEPSRPESLSSLWQWLTPLSQMPLTRTVIEAMRLSDQYGAIVGCVTRASLFCSAAESYIANAAEREFGTVCDVKESYVKAYARIVGAIAMLLCRECPLFAAELQRSLSGLVPEYSDLTLDSFAFERFWSEIANVASDGGQHLLASTLYRQAAKSLPPCDVGAFQRPRYIDAHVNSAISLSRGGRYSEALQELELARELADTLRGSRNRYYAYVEANVGVLLTNMGRLSEAEACLRRAIVLWSNTRPFVVDDHLPEPINARDALAKILRSTGDSMAVETTTATWEELRSGLESDIPDYIAGKLRSQVDVEAIRNGLEDLERRFGGDHSASIGPRRELATVLAEQGRRGDALRILDNLLDQILRTLGEEHVEYAATLFQLGQQQALDGSVELAMNTLKSADEIFRNVVGEDHPQRVDVLATLAITIAMNKSQSESVMEAWKCVVEAEELVARLFDSYCGTDEARLLQVSRAHYALTWTFKTIGLEGVNRGCVSAAQLLECVWRRKGRVVDELRRRANRSEQPINRLRRLWWRQLDGLQRGYLDYHQGNLSYTANATRHFRWIIERERLNEPSRHEWLRFHGKEENVVFIEYFRAWMPDDGTSGEAFSRRRGEYLVFVKEPAQEFRVVSLGDSEIIDELVSEFRQFAFGDVNENRKLTFGEARTNSAYAISLGMKLRRAILDPVLSRVRYGARMTIALDGDLALLPFEALPLDDATFLDEHVAINYVNSLWQMREFTRSNESQRGMTVIGNPNFDGACDRLDEPTGAQLEILRLLAEKSASPWKSLPGTQREADGVGDILEVRVLVGDEASAECLSKCCNVGVIHIATHGFYLPMSREMSTVAPLKALERSGLVFAGANRGLLGDRRAASCVLTAADVARLDLTKTDLVVLSACESGIGDAQPGEGIIGMRRALWAAGVQTMVTSLWSVPDLATAELMTHFYQSLRAGDSCVDALQVARRALRKNGYPPSAWAPFVVHGNPALIPWLRRR